MAFCPNCGTANTDQAERCVACGVELAVPKQKAKFKGTIMMSGIKAPAAAQPAPAPASTPPSTPPAQPAPASQPPQQAAAPARNLGFQKTMMGQPPIALPSANKNDPPPRASAPPPSRPNEIGHLPTIQQGFAPSGAPSPQVDPSAVAPTVPQRSQGTFAGDSAVAGFARSTGNAPASPANTFGGARGGENTGPAHGGSAPSGSFGQGATGSYGGAAPSGGAFGSSAPGYASRRSSLGGAYESTLPPAANAPNPAKVIAVGCGVVLALVLLVGGALWLAFGDRLKRLFGAEETSAEAAAWQSSIVQSLTKVNELCRSDCASAGVFFHPLKQAALMDEAKAVTPARLAKLTNTQVAHAAMLDSTEDTSVASELGLDPAQCARVVAEGAKVISCSVPDPTGKPSVLRIVHLSGISSL